MRDLEAVLDPADAADAGPPAAGAGAPVRRAVDRQPADVPLAPVARGRRASWGSTGRGSTSPSASCTSWRRRLEPASARADRERPPVYAAIAMTNHTRTPIDQTPEWRALTAHHLAVRDRHLRDLFADGSGPRAPLHGRRRGPLPRLLQAPDHRRDAAAAAGARAAGGCRGAPGRDVRGRPHQRDRGPRRPAHRAARTEGPDHPRRWSRRGPGRARGPGPDGLLRHRRPLRRLEGLHRQADPQRRQHRHRRVGPGSGDGHRGAAQLRGAHDALPVRVQRRRHGHPRRDARPGSGRDAVRRQQQDVHHARDADQRPHRPGVAAGEPRGRGRGRPSLRRGEHERREGGRVRHRHRQHVRVLGLGWRPLLDGLARSACH